MPLWILPHGPVALKRFSSGSATEEVNRVFERDQSLLGNLSSSTSFHNYRHVARWMESRRKTERRARRNHPQ